MSWIVYALTCAAAAYYASTKQRSAPGWFALAFVTSPLAAAGMVWYLGEPEAAAA